MSEIDPWWKERFLEKLAQAQFPSYMKEPVERWVLHGIEPGDFLCAVLQNDLKEACIRADENNQKCLFGYVKFLYGWSPEGCWGSREKFVAWAKKGGLEGTDGKETGKETENAG